MRNIFVAGIVLLAAGLAWHPFLPINKNLWSPAYVLVTAGAARNPPISVPAWLFLTAFLPDMFYCRRIFLST